MYNFFYVLSGNNNATYILNASSWKNIETSLKFYRAYNLKSKLQKSVLAFFLFIVGKFFPSFCKSKDDIKIYLKENINPNVDFNLDENSSVLISPTRDKVIVNHQGQYFHKFAFGKSFEKVQKESAIYSLLENSKEFQVASLIDLKTDTSASSCNFKLVNPPKHTNDQLIAIHTLPEILVEFFNSAANLQSIKVSDYLENLLKKVHSLNLDAINELPSYLAKIQKEEPTEVMPLGLVHRDFKPWNTLLRNELLIFDFEEAITAGPPLEDLLNYYIDPVIRYQSTKQVYALMFSKERVAAYRAYLQLLKINLQFELFIVTHMIERILFWTLAGENATAKCYQNLLNHIIRNHKP